MMFIWLDLEHLFYYNIWHVYSPASIQALLQKKGSWTRRCIFQDEELIAGSKMSPGQQQRAEYDIVGIYKGGLNQFLTQSELEKLVSTLSA
jgi:hypothetical protein